MYPIMHSIFEDKTGGEVFNCFGPWHFFYIFATIAAIVAIMLLMKGKSIESKDKILKIVSGITFGLYMLDIFVMPFAYGEIDVDKLPFHACTSMSIMCFVSNRNTFFKKYRVNFAALAFLCNLMYLAYPSGVMQYEIHPLSYRAVQTLLFHSVMVVYGLLALAWNQEELQFKLAYRNLALLGILTVWATLGNGLYSGEAEGYSHYFNWFFVNGDPFYVLPENVAKYICPWLNIVAFFSLDMIIYLIFTLIRRKREEKQAKQ
jgi:hypothetical protein